jgi:hypothetical protein
MLVGAQDALLEKQRQAVGGRGDAHEQVEDSGLIGGDTARDRQESVEESGARCGQFGVAGTCPVPH